MLALTEASKEGPAHPGNSKKPDAIKGLSHLRQQQNRLVLLLSHGWAACNLSHTLKNILKQETKM